ncbi:hypothetical protein EMGBS6_16940 [Opitutia bacterium]|nr:hypothetical protein EMGBS6_16940 [Opitutae bacterium]
MPALIAIRGLRKAYVMGDETVHALAGVDLDFQKASSSRSSVPRVPVSRP